MAAISIILYSIISAIVVQAVYLGAHDVTTKLRKDTKHESKNSKFPTKSI